jgi:hypothetical protein
MRLVATDLDGTLLRSDRTISAHTADVLAGVRADGGHVVLVTGRPVRWLSAVYAQLRGPLPLAICANGAVVYDPETDAILRTDPMAPQRLAEVCMRLRDEVPAVTFAVEIADSREMRHEARYPRRPDDNTGVRVITAPEELLCLPAVKLLVRAGERDSDEFAALVASCVGGLAEATHSSASGLVEISAVGVTKAAGLSWLCERLDVPTTDVVAFGDMPNDVPMLAWAGQAVAVANAHPAVKEAADEITLSNDEDGVAAYLSR